MKKTQILTWLCLFVLAFCFATEIDYNAALPVDPDLTIGKLPNGFTYYIKVNHKPEKRAELRLVVRAGSVQEDDDQLGLAHFTEHMAFNGTKHFPKNELRDYLNSIGMGYQGGLNGFTTYDYTVYQLQVPTDKVKELKNGILILSDWANCISFDDEEIEKERGVIMEELRRGLGAEDRIQKSQDKLVFAGSRYAERDPIGTMEIISSFKPETIKRFYRDWYRPDLQAVIAVGDFDPKAIESYIKEYFSPIPMPANPRLKQSFEVPVNTEPLCQITKDKETANTVVKLVWKVPTTKYHTYADYKTAWSERLHFQMLMGRFGEMRLQADPPFSYAYGFKMNRFQSKAMFMIFAMTKENGIERCLDVLLTEAKRLKRYGFTQSELDRAIQSTLNDMDKLLSEKDKTESDYKVWSLISSFASDEDAMGVEQQVSITRDLMQVITLQDINALSNELMPEGKDIILVSTPDKEEGNTPTETALMNLYLQAAQKDVTAYQDETNDEPLMKTMPIKGRIVKEKTDKATGITIWKLSNGATVYAKKTAFKNDEVYMEAFSPGGNCSYPSDLLITANVSSGLAFESGFGDFPSPVLQKKLAGKTVWGYPYISRFEEGFSGSSSAKDLETMLQLMYQYAHFARFDDTTFSSFQQQMVVYFQNRSLSPEECFDDSIQVVTYDRNPRMKVFTLEDLNQIQLPKAKDIFLERFRDFSDFNFIFVGSFDEAKLRQYCETYLASPAISKQKDRFIDDGVRQKTGFITKQVYMGKEDKSYVKMLFAKPLKLSSQTRTELNFLNSLLFEKMHENIRENRGGVYNVQFNAEKSKLPIPEIQAYIWMECAPERVNELSEAALSTLDSLQAGIIDEKYINVVKQTRLKQMETNLQSNEWWKDRIKDQLVNGFPLKDIMNETTQTQKLDKKTMQSITKKYLNHRNNLLRFELYPEKAKPE